MSREEATAYLKKLQAEYADFGKQFQKINEMENILTQDVVNCAKLTEGEENSGSAARSFVRSVFAMIEGCVFNLKQTALTLSQHGRGGFTQAELVMLEEISYDLTDKGETKEQVKFIPLTKNIRFAFTSTARAFQVQFSLVVDDAGWSTFKEAIDIRNRITHPKTTEDLKLSDEEIQTVADAGTWFLQNQRVLIEKLMQRVQTLEGILDKHLTSKTV